MKYAMLILSTALLMPAAAFAASAPPVRLKLADPTLTIGQGERIHVRTATDGYLVVLRTDTQGNVHMLFPLNPTDNGAIRAGQDYEVRGRGDRDAFTASEPTGSGTVLAAWADRPFVFTDFETHGHWKRAGLLADHATGDAAAVMLGVVDRMSPGSYRWDLATYTVRRHQYQAFYGGWHDAWVTPWYGPWYGGALGPWWWDYPYGYAPYVYPPSAGLVIHPRVRERRER